MNIEFIKWMCDKAEGFSVTKWSDVFTTMSFPLYEHAHEIKWWMEDDLFKDIGYPLLLQRAIEGVNKTSDSGERILEVVGMHSQRYLKYGRMCNIIDLEKTYIDNAKESALMYIYEQEKEG